MNSYVTKCFKINSSLPPRNRLSKGGLLVGLATSSSPRANRSSEGKNSFQKATLCLGYGTRESCSRIS